MPPQPLILISPSTQKKGAEFADISLNLSECYPRAVIAAGGVPLVLSSTPVKEYIAESVRRADGIMLTGGEDVQPSLHTPDLASDLAGTVTATEPERDLFELLLIAEVFRQRKPLLAICRGHQLVNVAFGGTLYVDIPSQLPQALQHRRMELKSEPVHEIRLAPGSLIASLFAATTIRVNSTHHQAIAHLAPPFQVTATSPDGVIEVTELARTDTQLLPWFLSVQFHPERLAVNYAEFRPLFACFLAACAAERERGRGREQVSSE